MSSQQITRSTKTSAHVSDVQPSDTAIAVTNHARLRYLQRVDAGCQNPNEQLRKMFRTGQPSEQHPDVPSGKARRAGDVLVVYKGSEASPKIITVLRDTTTDRERR